MPYEAINHTTHAGMVAQYTASFFVNEARKSSPVFINQTLEELLLIYNYSPTVTTGGIYYYIHF